MKRLFTFFIALLSACTFSSYAAILEGTCGDNLTWTVNTEDNTLVISGTGEMTNYNNYSSFAPWYNCKSYIKYVTIEDGVTSIGDYAFHNCESLTSITIPNSVTSIGNYAFYDCFGLTSITIPNNVTSIGNSAFAECFGLTFVTIGNSVTSIGNNAFSDCRSLTSITIPNGVTSIGDYAFAYCFGLTSVTIPNSVTSIGSHAFSGCSGLTSPVYNAHCFAYMPSSYTDAYTIPEGIKQIVGGAFQSCKSLTSITIPNSVTSIGNGAFGDCYGLTSITIPNSVTSIGGSAFSGCRSLTSITIPNSVTSIGVDAFSDCSRLTSVTIPNSVTSIGDYAFWGCSSLAVVNVEATTPPTLGADALTSSPTCNIPCGTLEVYQASDWQNFVGEYVEQCSDDSGDDGDMDKDLTIIFSDRDNNQISAQTVTLSVPLAPEIAGFTFLYWLPVAEPVEDVITLQAVYKSNNDTPTAAPEVFVNPSNPAQKLIRNGQLFILRAGKEYDVIGRVNGGK